MKTEVKIVLGATMLLMAFACGGGGGAATGTNGGGIGGTGLMKGEVSTFSSSSSKPSLQKAKPRYNAKIDDSDLAGVQSIVTLFVLGDETNTPVATIKTGSSGNYTIDTEDLRSYLLSANLICVGARDNNILAAFENLGAIKVRASYTSAGGNITTIETMVDLEDLDPDEIKRTDPLTTIAARQVENAFEQFGLQIDGNAFGAFSGNLIEDIFTSSREIELAENQTLNEYANLLKTRMS